MSAVEILILILIIAAGIVAIVELVNDRGSDLVAWAVLLVCAALLIWRLN